MDPATIPQISCPHCASQMPETAAFCPGCGRALRTPERAQGRVGVFPEPIAGALAYITLIPAILFVFLEPYKQNRFVRFHSIQCLLFWAVSIVAAIALRLAGMLLYIVPVLGPLLLLVLWTVVGLAAFVVWLVLVVKAFQGEMFELPLIGDYAARQAAPAP